MTSKLTITDERIEKIAVWLATESHSLNLEMLTCLRELQERRKADINSEPYGFTDGDRRGMIYEPQYADRLNDPLPVYRHAQPAPASEPVFFIEIEGDDWINAGRIEGKNRPDLGLLPDGINYLYAAPQPAPVVGGEPVAEVLSSRPGNDTSTIDRALPVGTKLYRHAQPAPVVPEEKPMPNPLSMYVVDAVAAIAEAKGWNACRAAMLQAGNSPVIPDGYRLQPISEYEAMCATVNSDEWPQRWAPVSERMPDDDDFVYIWPRPDFGVELHVGQHCECSPKGDGWYAQVYEQNYGIEWYPITVTHWMPLPADPQEVNNG